MSSEYSHLKVADLKRELKSRGLSTSGTKDELITRLTNYRQQLLNVEHLNENIIEETDILDEDVLEGELDDAEEDEVLKKTLDNDTEPCIESPEKKLPVEPKSLSTQETPVDEFHEPPKKKIVLVRKTSVPLLGTDEPLPEEENKNGSESGTTNGHAASGTDMKVKITELSKEERLKMRAQKFGTKIIEDKKATRAARFGIHDTSLNESIDVLKNRAQRFGSVVSSKLSKESYEEKLRARKARFGVLQSLDEYEEKKRFRLQRFTK